MWDRVWKGEEGKGLLVCFHKKDNGDNFIRQKITSFYNVFGAKTWMGNNRLAPTCSFDSQ